MSRRARRVNFSPDMNEPAIISVKHPHGGQRHAGNNKRGGGGGVFGFRLPKSSRFSSVKFLRRLSAKVAKAIQMVSTRRKRRAPTSSSSSTLAGSRPRSFVAPFDSHQSEAIEDCIEFINSSSSLPRSNSLSATSSSL